jgi:ribonucleoside-diphosphate reductase alpha chain
MEFFMELEELKKNGEAPEFLTEIGYKTLTGGYLLPNETPKGMWSRVARTAAAILNKPELEEKFFNMFWKGWVGLATPVASNMGTNRGLPISCYSISPQDSTDSIMNKGHELAMLTKNGGGVGVYMGDLRPAGAKISTGGTSEGMIPFAKIYDSITVGISQGNVRRGAAAVYLPVDHGDIKSFLRMRRPEGDPNRQCLNLHHAVCIPDSFMNKVAAGDEEAQELLREIYKTRLETGEPYIFYSDNVNSQNPEAYTKNNLTVSTSNICSEILLYTDHNHTFVCCLSSLNLAKWHEWKDTDTVELSIYLLDAVLSEFIDKAQKLPGLEAAVRSAIKGRALGLGVMGWHTLLQQEHVSMDSFRAKILNKAIFKHIHENATKASRKLAQELGEPEWCKGTGLRATHLIAVAPTASNSLITGNISAGIEPINANAYVKKTAKGTFIEFNPLLKAYLQKLGKDTEETWNKIVKDEGSVRSLDFLTAEDKAVFKTAFEIDQLTLINLAADRQPYICQGQSLNLFFSKDVDPQYFHEVHWSAWQQKIKTLYYVRSSSVLRADLSSRGECVACEG